MPLNEENTRIILLACIIIVYVIFGAIMMKYLEYPFEKRLVHNYWKMYEEFEEKLLNGTAKTEELKSLLYGYSNVTAALGVPGKYERWNFLGSLYFAVTIVTTIGYGSYTPNTNAGKIFVIFYGLLGCASGILFFNLFLERAVTFLALFLREFYSRKLLKHRSTGNKENDPPTEWKPSVYAVLLCLLLVTTIVITIFVPIYSILEDWTYVESTYFCFVSFATVGFGDFVAAQKSNYRFRTLYTYVNILILMLGCCFAYCLFNVISIVLKQILNRLIIHVYRVQAIFRKEDSECQPERMMRKYSLKMQKERRNQKRRSSIAIIRRNLTRKSVAQDGDVEVPTVAMVTSAASSADDRKLSDDGLISMKDFLTSNQINLALMQKQLQETSNMQSSSSLNSVQSTAPRKAPVAAVGKALLPTGRFIPSTIGPLAILCDKLGDK